MRPDNDFHRTKSLCPDDMSSICAQVPANCLYTQAANEMPRSRMIKTLAVLLGAMTLGTFVLICVEPARGPATSQAQVFGLAVRDGDIAAEQARLDQVYRSTEIPIQPGKWRYIVIHDSVGGMTGNALDGSHFRIYGLEADGRDGRIEATGHWRAQSSGAHITVPGNANYGRHSIGICLVGDLAEREPSPAQMASLRALVHDLQRRLLISGEYVYLQRWLTGEPCPGKLFPAGEFRSHLLTIRR